MVFYYHRPLSAIYGDNYRYGTSLYAPGMNDIERKYRSTLSVTHLRSDRGDLGMYTFAGSHLHGGTPAAEKVLAPKIKGSKSSNLYAPLGETRPYSSGGFYDHLRAVSPEPRRRPAKSSAVLDEPSYAFPSKVTFDSGYRTLPSRLSDIDSDLKKSTTTKTTVTESWVPLTTYIYNTPFHTYYYKATPYSSYTYRTADDLYSYDYLDDFKRYSTTTTKTTSKNVDALDLSMTSKYDYSSSMEKCSKIQSQLEEVNRWVSEAETKLKSEVVSSRSKLQSELAQVALVLDDTARYNDELHEAIRKQAKQITNLTSKYDRLDKNISEVLDTLDRSKARCQTLQSEVSSLQSSMEMKTTKTTRTIII